MDLIEYYVVYENATGNVRRRGEGPPGIADAQVKALGAGLAIIKVPVEALDGMDVDLLLLKAVAAKNVGLAAEIVRQRFITPGSGKAMSYQAKADEARALTADAAAPAPILTAEAAVRGMTIAALVSEILGLRAAWETAEAAINAAEMRAKGGIAAATNIAALVAAATVDWDALAAA